MMMIDDDDENELFLWNGRWIEPYFQTGPLSEVFIIVDIGILISLNQVEN